MALCGRQLARFEPKSIDAQHPSQRMRAAIDSPRGRALYSRRIATVEPVFANIRHHKRMSRLRAARPGQGVNAMAALLPGAQHREDRHAGDAPALKGKSAAHWGLARAH